MLETVVPPCFRDPCAPSRGEPRWALVVAVLGSSMAFLDSTFVNIALPVMQRDLAVTLDRAQWIVEAYLLFLASLVLVGGALGDRLGRRRVFVAGASLFAVASIACGAAPGALSLIVARGVQGVGAALLVPGSLSLISAAYPERRTRDAAIGTWSAASAVVSAGGPVAGGWLVAHASWRWLFLLNVPVAVAVVVIARRHVADTRNEQASRHIDSVGATLVTGGLGLVVYGLVAAGRGGSGRAPLGFIGLGALVLCAFVWVQARSPAPMLPLHVFRVKTFAGANVLTLLVYGALGAGLFFIPFNLIQVQGYSPSAAGAALLPFVLLVSVLSPPIGALSGKIGPRAPLVVGSAAAALGFALLARPTLGGPYWETFFPGILVLGVGMGCIVAPLSAAVMGALEPRYAGMASGINNAVARAAGLLAVAALGIVVTARFDTVLDDRLAALSLSPQTTRALDRVRRDLGATEPLVGIAPGLRVPIHQAVAEAYVAAFRSLMLACSGLTALAALTAWVTIEQNGSTERDVPQPTLVRRER